MKPFSFRTFAMLLLMSGLAAATSAGQSGAFVPRSSTSSDITFHASSDLVLVDVMALSAKSNVPDETLKRRDFHVFDNGRPVEIKTFDSGRQTRPLALWLVVQCRMQGWDKQGSGLFAGQISLFHPAFKHLEADDRLAVAHWCDDGDARLDLQPTANADQSATALEHVLASTVSGKTHGRSGEVALERTLQLIVDATRSTTPESLPVAIFLYGDYSGMPRAEADHLVDELLGTSAVVFGLKDRRSPGMWWLPGEQKEVAHYIATETGGQYLAVTPDGYADALEEILRQLHFRYELGFKPEVLDSKRHKLRVVLSEAAKNEHPGVRLRSRPDYVPIRH